MELLDEWAADESGYDEEVLPELERNLDRNRRESGWYRRLFPDDNGDEGAASGHTAPTGPGPGDHPDRPTHEVWVLSDSW